MEKPQKIHAALIAVMRAVGPIAKDRQNTQQKYNFRGVDDVYNACHPHFAEHGVYSTSEILDAKHETTTVRDKSVIRAVLRMRFTFHADDGSSVSTEVIGEGLDYGGDKASNKAMSAADKYAILQLLKIPTAMADSDAPVAIPKAAGPTAAPRRERVNSDDLRALYQQWASGQSFDEGFSQEDKREFFLRDCREFASDESLTIDAATWDRQSLEKCIRRIGA